MLLPFMKEREREREPEKRGSNMGITIIIYVTPLLICGNYTMKSKSYKYNVKPSQHQQ